MILAENNAFKEESLSLKSFYQLLLTKQWRHKDYAILLKNIIMELDTKELILIWLHF